MKKLILILGLAIGLVSFAGEAMAQPPHANAWGKRYKNWNKGHGEDAWEHRYWNKKHYKPVRVVRPAVVRPVNWRDRYYKRPVPRGVSINARARF
ncbi:MAG: hypothetical protein JO301_03700 [Chitinophagaceae bacterium]|nr:hypothetical protein [Chitinophagaceae bacterium]